MIENFITKLNCGTILAFGKRFTSPDEAQSFVETTLATREQLAGRKLSVREAEYGLSGNRSDSRSLFERMEANDFRVVMPATAPGDSNPFRDPETRNAMLGQKRQTRKSLLAEAEAEWDAKQKAEASAKEISPKRDQAVAWAEANWEQTAFNPNATAGDVQFAEQLLEQARKGCLNHFSAMADTTVAKQHEQFEAKRQAFDLQRLQAEANLRAMAAPSHPFTGAPPSSPITKINRFTDGSVSVVNVVTKEVVASYAPGEVPEDLA